MNTIRVLSVAFAGAVLVTLAAADEKKPDKGSDNAKLLVGTWEVIKADKDNLVGDTAEFSNDGKFTYKSKGKNVFVATYKVDNDKLVCTIKNSGSTSGSTETTIEIKKLTDTEFVMVAETGTVEFKRKKAS